MAAFRWAEEEVKVLQEHVRTIGPRQWHRLTKSLRGRTTAAIQTYYQKHKESLGTQPQVLKARRTKKSANGKGRFTDVTEKLKKEHEEEKKLLLSAKKVQAARKKPLAGPDVNNSESLLKKIEDLQSENAELKKKLEMREKEAREYLDLYIQKDSVSWKKSTEISELKAEKKELKKHYEKELAVLNVYLLSFWTPKRDLDLLICVAARKNWEDISKEFGISPEVCEERTEFLNSRIQNIRQK